jgi:hypothetical protein
MCKRNRKSVVALNYCVQDPQPVYVTAGIEQPTDLTAHMTAGIVAASMALHEYGRISFVDAQKNIKRVQDLYNVTVITEGVLKHYRSLWTSDSFYDDKLWAVCSDVTFQMLYLRVEKVT